MTWKPPRWTGPAPHPICVPGSTETAPASSAPSDKRGGEKLTIANRGRRIMACGTGKTLTALFINEKFAAQRTSWCADAVAVAAGPDAARVDGHHQGGIRLPAGVFDETVAEPDAVVANTEPMWASRSPPTPRRSLRFFCAAAPPACGVCHLVLAADRYGVSVGWGPAFDLVIADEAHRCAGPVSSDFGTILDSEKIKRAAILATATPRLLHGPGREEKPRGRV